MADAAVLVKNVETNVTVTSATNAAGLYTVTSLMPGAYTIEVQKDGFEKTLVTSVVISATQTSTTDVQLRVGQVNSTITVSSEAPLLTPTTPQVATTVEQDLATNLPYAERSTLGATLLVAGVRGDPQYANQVQSENPGIYTQPNTPGSSLRVGGAFPGRTSIMIDGSDVTQTSFPRAGVTVSGDMVQETTVVSGGLAAQYGRSQGGVIIQATRGGTNAFHGGLTWRHSDPALQAQQLGSTLRPALHQNFFGIYAGGPVVLPKVYNGRDKTFFYVGVEPGRLNNVIGAQGQVPTVDEIAGHLNNAYALIDTSILRRSGAAAALAAPRAGGLYYQFPLNAAGFPSGPQYSSASQYVPIPNNDVSAQLAQNKFAQFFLSQLPTPSNPGPYATFLRPDGLWMPNGNNISYARGVQNFDDRFSFRIDHVLTSRDRLFGRYTDIPVTGNRFFILPPSSPVQQAPADTAYTKNLALSESHIFSGSLVNELRVQYLRNRQLRAESASALSKDWAASFGLTPATFGKGFPNFGLGFTSNAGVSNGTSQVDENYQLSDDLTWTHGKHVLKMGVDVRRLQSNQYNLAGVYGGSYNFGPNLTNSGVSGGSAIATLALGLINGFSNTPTPVPAYYRWHYYGGYFQDDWRILPKLTINAGLRYEYESPRIEKYNNQGTFIPSLTGTLNGLPARGAFCFSGACGLSDTIWPRNYNGFEPRLGIAWSPTSRVTVRAVYNLLRAPLTGYSLTPNPDFNVPSATIGGQTGGVTPNSAVDFITNPVGPLTSALSALQGRGPFFTVQGLTVPYVDQANTVPYTQQWGLTLQFQLWRTDMLQVAYNGLKGTHLVSNFAPPQNLPDLANLFNLISQGYNFTPSEFNPYGIKQNGAVIKENMFTALLPYQNFFNSSLQEMMNRSGNSTYHALYLTWNHRFAQGLSLLSSFTWSKSINDVGGDVNTAQSIYSAAPVQSPTSRSSDKSVANFDVPLTFTTGFTYVLPLGRGKFLSAHNKYIDAVIGNWKTSGTYNVQDGFPMWVTLGSAGYWFSTGGGTTLPASVNLRPNIVSGQACINQDWRQDPINKPYINSSFFSMPGSMDAPAFGAAPPTLSACRAPKITTFDGNLYRRFQLGRSENRYVELGVNAINALNHSAFMMNPNTGHSLFNAYSGNPATPFTVQPSFGFLNVANTAPRLVQLSLRLYW